MDVQAISVIGLGKLGSCLAATLANAGFAVEGVDRDEEIVETINKSESPFPEPKLDEYIKAAGDDLQASTDIKRAVDRTDVTFIFVDTYSHSEVQCELTDVHDVCDDIGVAMRDSERYHTVVLTSTVMPGSTTGKIKSWLEETSGKNAERDFGLCYSPEFYALGSAIDGQEDPDFYLIGEQSKEAGDVVSNIYRRIGDESSPIIRTSIIDAEIIKMAINAYVTMKISFVNNLSGICDGRNANVDKVTKAMQHDSRINGEYLKAGARFGGPCFPRDNTAYRQLAKDAGTRAPLAKATDEINEEHTWWIANKIRDVTPKNEIVTILGTTYKPNTNVIEESQGIKLIDELADEFDLRCYDPEGLIATKQHRGKVVQCCGSAVSALEGAETAVITVPWDEFTNPILYDGHSVQLFDPWRLFEMGALPDSISYYPLGADGSHEYSE